MSQEFVLDQPSVIKEFLTHKPKMVSKICLSAKTVHREIVELADRLEIPIERGVRDPQKIQAWVQLRSLDEGELFDRSSKKERDLIVALDHVQDPRNLGAIARSVAFFGGEAIIAPKDRQVLLTDASISTSQGAFSLLDLYSVTNLGRALDKLKKEGYWVIGTVCEANTAVHQFKNDFEKAILVLGSEEKGISPTIRKKCDVLLNIPGVPNSLGSLNVSVAAGIVLHSFWSK